MATRTDTLKVVYVVDGQSNVVGSFRAVGKEADELDKRVAGAGRSMDSTAGSAGRLATAVGIGLGTGIAATATALGIYIRNTMEAEKVQSQLAARIRDTGAAAGRTIEQLNAQASQMQRVTLFDDNAVGNAQAALLTFKQLQGLTFDRAVEGAADLATTLGTDMESAARMLGRALTEPSQGLRSLAAAGVVFTAEERKALQAMVESGEQAEAHAVILDRLAQSTEGAAEAAGNTLSGALTRLKNAAASALQGDSGSEGMQGLRTGIEDLIDTLNDPATHDAIDSIAEGILGIANAVAQTLPLLVEFWEKAQRFTTMKLGGVGDVGDLEQIRFEIAEHQKWLDAHPDEATFNWTPYGSNRKRHQDELARLKDLEEMSLMFFGDPNEPGIRWIDPSDPASLAESRHLRPPGSGAAITPLPTTGDRRPDAKDKEWESFVKDMQALEKVWLDVSTDVTNAQTKAANDRADAIEQGRAATDALIADMEQELSLVGMTAEERERAIALRYADANATDEQRERIAALATEISRARESQYVIDDIKGSVVGFAVAAGSGFGGTADAFEDMTDRIKRAAIQLLAEKAVQWLFGLLLGGGTTVADNGSAGFANYDIGGTGGTAFGPNSFALGAAFSVGPLSGFGNQVHTRPQTFAFARGGIFAEQDAEAIMPLARGPDGSLGVRAQGVGAGTVVQVINNSGGQARTERGTTPEGGDFIKVIIDRAVGAVNENILKQGGSTGRAIASTFGLSRAGTPVSG